MLFYGVESNFSENFVAWAVLLSENRVIGQMLLDRLKALLEAHVITIQKLFNDLPCLSCILSERRKIGMLEYSIFQLGSTAADQGRKRDVMS